MKVEVADIFDRPYVVLIPEDRGEKLHLEMAMRQLKAIIKDVFNEDYLRINRNGEMEINVKPLQLPPPEEEYK